VTSRIDERVQMNSPSTMSGLELITMSLVEPSLQRIWTCSSRSVSPALTRASSASAYPGCTRNSAARRPMYSPGS